MMLPSVKVCPISPCVTSKANRYGTDLRRIAAGRELLSWKSSRARLHVVHLAGIIHRDLKPENVIIDSRGQPVLVDFGLAQNIDEARHATGTIEGTLAYMPPEQQEGNSQASGPACDIYSLGVLLFELLAGQIPFQGTFAEILDQKRSERYPPLQALGMDAALVSLSRAMCGEPDARFPTMLEFADRLAAYLRDEVTEVPVASPASPRSSQAASTMSHPMDPRVAGEVLQSLREWGWEVGLARLETQIQVMPDLQRRGMLRLLTGWIKGERGDHTAGIEQLRAAEQIPELRAWARTARLLSATAPISWRKPGNSWIWPNRKRPPIRFCTPPSITDGVPFAIARTATTKPWNIFTGPRSCLAPITLALAAWSIPWA